MQNLESGAASAKFYAAGVVSVEYLANNRIARSEWGKKPKKQLHANDNTYIKLLNGKFKSDAESLAFLGGNVVSEECVLVNKG